MIIAKKITPLSVKSLLDEAATAIASQADLSFQEPNFEARLLLTFATKKNYAWMISHAFEKVSEVFTVDQITKFYDALKRRLEGQPIAYILGTQAFWSLELTVSDCTLIPRQDTEILVEAALALSIPEHAKVLDLGTGTGAIALALAKERPNWQVTGLDTIPAAVTLAMENAHANKVDATFLQSNWFSALSSTSDKFDLIVSNPPYVETDSRYIKQGDLRFEPLSALVSGKDGLDDIRHIIAHASQFLVKGGYLLVEHGKDQQLSIMTLFEASGFTHVQGMLDYNNLPRATLGQYVTPA